MTSNRLTVDAQRNYAGDVTKYRIQDGKVSQNQIGHGIVTEDGQARIDTAITDTTEA